MTQPETTVLEALEKKGVLIKLRIRMPRFSKGLKAEDLKLDPDKIPEGMISLGKKRIVSKKSMAKFSLLEGRAHVAVECATFPFLGGIGRYLPNEKLGALLVKLNELSDEYTSETISFMESYGDLRDEAMDEWEAFAEKMELDEDATARLLADVSKSFPPAEKIERKFSFEWTLFHAKIPEELDAKVIEAADADAIAEARKEAAQQAAAKAEEGYKDWIVECVSQVRMQCFELCNEMSESIENGKSEVHQKTLNRLVNFIENFKQIDFAGDTPLNDVLQEFKEKFLTKNATAYRDDEFALAALKGGITKLGRTAKEMAEQEAQDLKDEFCGIYNRVVEVE